MKNIVVDELLSDIVDLHILKHKNMNTYYGTINDITEKHVFFDWALKENKFSKTYAKRRVCFRKEDILSITKANAHDTELNWNPIIL